MQIDIKIDRLRIHAFHGVLPQEKRVGADFYVTLVATAEVSEEALLHDRLVGTVDYGMLVRVVQHEMAIPSNLLEHVAMRMASAVLRTFPTVLRISILLKKENPPLGVQSEGIGVKIVLDR